MKEKQKGYGKVSRQLDDVSIILKEKREKVSQFQEKELNDIRKVLNEPQDFGLRIRKEEKFNKNIDVDFLRNNKELYDKEFELRKTQEALFAELFAQAKETTPDITEKEFTLQLNERLTELQEHNYKIDANLLEEEKLENGWEKKYSFEYEYQWHGDKDVELLEKYDNKRGTIIEYIDNSHNKRKISDFLSQNAYEKYKKIAGEQLFNWQGVVNLGLQDKLPSEEWVNNLLQEDKEKLIEKFGGKRILFPGHIKGGSGWSCFNIGYYANFWLSSGKVLTISKGGRVSIGMTNNTLSSVRLVKD